MDVADPAGHARAPPKGVVGERDGRYCQGDNKRQDEKDKHPTVQLPQ